MINKVTLLGNAGADPECRQVGETSVAKIRIATSETFKKNGKKTTDTQWHTVVAWGKLAEIVSQYVKKGQMLYVDGKLKYSSYEKDGITRYTTDIVANNIKMIGGRTAEGQQQYQQQQYQQPQQQPCDLTADENNYSPF